MYLQLETQMNSAAEIKTIDNFWGIAGA